MTSLRPITRADVLLVPFPFTDLTAGKVRPALVVGRVLGEDLVVAFVTSRAEGADARTEVLIQPAEEEFGATGLKVESAVRLNKLATLHRRLALRRIGRAGPRIMGEVARALRYVFEL